MDPFAANQSPVADDTTILTTFPMPLARAWQRVLVASSRPSVHHEALLTLAQTLTYVVGGIAVAAYTQQPEASDPTLNRSLRNLRHVTFGQWLGWVRGALAAAPPETPLLSDLATAYEVPDNGMLLLGYEGLRGQMVVHLGYTGDYGSRSEVSVRLLLELLNQYQLWLTTHPPAPTSSWDPMGIVTVVAPGLRAALGYVQALAEYPLLGLVRDEEGHIQVLRLMGFAATESAVEMDPDAAAPGTLLLADPDELPILVLDPWLVFARCSECGAVQVAALAGQSAGQTHYTGLDCGHGWSVPEPPLPVTLDAALAEAAWTPEVSVPPDSPSAVQEAMFARWDQEQAEMAAQRNQGRGRPPAPHVVTAEELDAQTTALRQEMRGGGDRRIAPPDQATAPEEMDQALADYQELTRLQEQAERR